MLNLLVNACKFTKDASISVFCEINDNKDLITIKVKDEGIGIKEEDRSKLFIPFENIEYGSDLNPSGTGLGLSICYRMLMSLGCTIRLDESFTNGPNRGSTFSFTIHA